jgi:hypothetical protein
MHAIDCVKRVLLIIKKIQPVVEKKIQPKVASAKPQAASNA